MAKRKVDSIEKLATLVEEGFEEVGAEIGDLDKKITEETRDIKERLRLLEYDTNEIKDEVRAISKAVDKDAVKIINHDSRIKRLEHALE